MNAPFLQINALHFQRGTRVILPQIDLSLGEGHLLCLLGPSGCGKTTLLRLIAGLEPLQQGDIHCEGQNISRLPVRQRRMGMMFQQPALFPTMSVRDNIRFGLGHLPKAGQEARIAQLLSLTRLDDLAEALPHQLSGGQQQRAALARALAPQPRLLLLDEPFANLDPALRQQMQNETRSLLKAQSITAIMVTHDAAEAMAMADSIAVMQAGGHVLAQGSPEQLYNHPGNAEVAAALGAFSLVPASLFDKGSDGESLMIRPEGLEQSAAGLVTTLLSKQFCGGHWLLSLQHGNHVLRLLQPAISHDAQAVQYQVALAQSGWVKLPA